MALTAPECATAFSAVLQLLRYLESDLPHSAIEFQHLVLYRSSLNRCKQRIQSGTGVVIRPQPTAGAIAGCPELTPTVPPPAG